MKNVISILLLITCLTACQSEDSKHSVASFYCNKHFAFGVEGETIDMKVYQFTPTTNQLRYGKKQIDANIKVMSGDNIIQLSKDYQTKALTAGRCHISVKPRDKSIKSFDCDVVVLKKLTYDAPIPFPNGSRSQSKTMDAVKTWLSQNNFSDSIGTNATIKDIMARYGNFADSTLNTASYDYIVARHKNAPNVTYMYLFVKNNLSSRYMIFSNDDAASWVIPHMKSQKMGMELYDSTIRYPEYWDGHLFETGSEFTMVIPYPQTGAHFSYIGDANHPIKSLIFM